jgi:hypothetical protein
VGVKIWKKMARGVNGGGAGAGGGQQMQEAHTSAGEAEACCGAQVTAVMDAGNKERCRCTSREFTGGELRAWVEAAASSRSHRAKARSS